MLRYLKGIAELKLKFENSIIKIIEIVNEVKKYIDNNYANNVSNKKFIINYIFFINQGLVI